MERGNHPQPTLFVIFGAGGDLTWRKLVPALYNLFLDGQLPEQLAVLGVDRKALSDEKFGFRAGQVGYSAPGSARPSGARPRSAHRTPARRGPLAGRSGCGRTAGFVPAMKNSTKQERGDARTLQAAGQVLTGDGPQRGLVRLRGSAGLDSGQYHRFAPPALRSVSLHPAQHGTFLLRGTAGPDQHDEPGPAGVQGPAACPAGLPGESAG